MSFYEIVAKQFHQQIEQLSLSVDAIADIAGTGAARAAEAIFAEGKLFSCGAGLDAASAAIFSDLLRQGLQRERPSLPVVELNARTSQSNDASINWIADQLRALGQSNDFAIIFCTQLKAAEIELLANALAQRQVKSIWLGNQGPGASLAFPDAHSANRLALTHVSAICLAQLIDATVFGPLEDE